MGACKVHCGLRWCCEAALLQHAWSDSHSARVHLHSHLTPVGAVAVAVGAVVLQCRVLRTLCTSHSASRWARAEAASGAWTGDRYQQGALVTCCESPLYFCACTQQATMLNSPPSPPLYPPPHTHHHTPPSSLPPIQADYYPEYLYASVILLSVDRPSHLSQEQPAAAAAAAEATAAAAAAKDGAGAAASGPRLSDSGSSAAGGSSELPAFASGMGKVQRGRLFGAAGAKKRQVERRAAAAGCSAALQPMQPTVEQASMFLFRWAWEGVWAAVSSSRGQLVAAAAAVMMMHCGRELLRGQLGLPVMLPAILQSARGTPVSRC